MRQIGLITTAIVLGLICALTLPSARVHSLPMPARPAVTEKPALRLPPRKPVASSPRPVAVRTHHGPTTISMPRIGVRAVVGRSLARGAIFWDRVGRPGQGTTVAIAGHDVTPVPGFHGHGPFHDINELRKHDRIYVTWHGRRYGYRVTGQRLIPATNLHMADLTRFERLLLTTCWPRGSSAYRLVVYARPAR